MAGFTLQRRDMVLKFADDTNLAGLEIVALMDIPLSLFLEFQTSISGEDSEEGGIEKGFRLFAEKMLVDWNLEDDNGVRIEPSVEAFFELPPQTCTQIIQEWSGQVSEPDPLLSTTSSNSLPLEQDNEELMVISQQSPQS